MRLAIADPPPLRATRWYAGRKHANTRNHSADNHPAAGDWNRVERHRELAEHLISTYDGWAIACPMDAVAAGVYVPLPYGTRVMVWHRTNALPSKNRIGTRVEAVLVCPPGPRVLLPKGAPQVPDVLTCPAPKVGFAGAKPAEWTRWVLDALGYDPDLDTVDDLFPGSGSVTNAIQQGTLL